MIWHLAGQFGPCQTLAYDLADGQMKVVTVVHAYAIVEAVGLFVDVAEQCEGSTEMSGTTDPPFEQTPQVFKPVGVDVAIHVGFGVVHNLMIETVHLPVAAGFAE